MAADQVPSLAASRVPLYWHYRRWKFSESSRVVSLGCSRRFQAYRPGPYPASATEIGAMTGSTGSSGCTKPHQRFQRLKVTSLSGHWGPWGPGQWCACPGPHQLRLRPTDCRGQVSLLLPFPSLLNRDFEFVSNLWPSTRASLLAIPQFSGQSTASASSVLP